MSSYLFPTIGATNKCQNKYARLKPWFLLKFKLPFTEILRLLPLYVSKDVLFFYPNRRYKISWRPHCIFFPAHLPQTRKLFPYRACRHAFNPVYNITHRTPRGDNHNHVDRVSLHDEWRNLAF
jgi:hypothetical protein